MSSWTACCSSGSAPAKLPAWIIAWACRSRSAPFAVLGVLAVGAVTVSVETGAVTVTVWSEAGAVTVRSAGCAVAWLCAFVRKVARNHKYLLFSMVPAARLELARPFNRQILSLLCLPFHHAADWRSQWLSRKRIEAQTCAILGLFRWFVFAGFRPEQSQPVSFALFPNQPFVQGLCKRLCKQRNCRG